jgi:hypothetical protein
MYPFVCQQKSRCNSAGSRNADCLHGWRETSPPPSAGPKWIYCFCSPPLRRTVSKGCRPKRSRNVRVSRFGGCGRKHAGRACGRKGLVGRKEGEAVPSQMSHKAKMWKTANRKTTLKSCREEDVQMIRWVVCECECECESDLSFKMRVRPAGFKLASMALVQATGLDRAETGAAR